MKIQPGIIMLVVATYFLGCGSNEKQLESHTKQEIQSQLDSCVKAVETWKKTEKGWMNFYVKELGGQVFINGKEYQREN